MKYPLFFVVGMTFFVNVANAAICKDFDDDFNVVEYECGTSWRDTKLTKNNTKSEGKKQPESNVYMDSPLFMPATRHFYSISALENRESSFVQNRDDEFFPEIRLKQSYYGLSEEFGYGVTDEFSMEMAIDGGRQKLGDDGISLANLSLGAVYRAINQRMWKLDFIGGYTIDTLWNSLNGFFEKDVTSYTWTGGVRGGYETSRFTIAGKLLFNYNNTEMFSGDRAGLKSLLLGLDGQLVINKRWSIVAGIGYNKFQNRLINSTVEGAGWTWDPINDYTYFSMNHLIDYEFGDMWYGSMGVNYHIDMTKFIGVYVDAVLNTVNNTYKDTIEIVGNGHVYSTNSVVAREKCTNSVITGIKFGISF